MGFSFEVSVPVLTVFLQGILSFFSPCVLPILPLYIGYLSGGAGVKGEDGEICYKRKKVMLHTVCFVAGVSFAFFVLGLGVSAVGVFFRSNQTMFARIGGVLVLLFGLYQLGVLGQPEVLGRERRLPFHLDRLAMSPWTAFLMGFTFSFAWTPCVGPALASVLLMAASSSSRMVGFLFIGVYTIGFILPFLAAGLFTTSLLKLFKRHMGVVRYTVKLGGLLLVVLGLLMVSGKMNEVTGYLSQLPSTGGEAQTKGHDESVGEPEGGETGEDGSQTPKQKQQEASTQTDGPGDSDSPAAGEEQETKIPAPDFELKDQFGEVHRLSDYKGKTVFLNFWATWCPPCRAEMPDIQKLYEEYETEGDQALIVLGVAGPNMGNEKSEEEIAGFLEENGYTYPVVMDTEGSLFAEYAVYAFPTTFMIDREGNVFGYVSGQISYDMMKDIISQTMEGKRRQ
ncbi:MAG: redoxin domain-containing protein [Hungatella sp.]|nr:redoxin domain-containing protein [Hungatella sp.]